MAIIISILIFFIYSVSFAQFKQGSIDTVYSVSFGSGQAFGQSAIFFPKNIFGLPDTNARFNAPSSSEDQICSIGLNGSIIIGFKGKIVRDLPGKDFTVFENAFEFLEGRIFSEPAIIEVSKDGIIFYQFPIDSLTLKGCSGTYPTNGNENPYDPIRSGGNSYDLSEIGIDSVIVIRITDVSTILQNEKHPLYSPIVTGFDLDAIVGLHLQDIEIVSSVHNEYVSSDIISESEFVHYVNQGETVSLYSLNGTLILSSKNGVIRFNQIGTYILLFQNKNETKRKIIHIY